MKKLWKVIISISIVLIFIVVCMLNIKNPKIGFLFQNLISNIIWTILFVFITSIYINWDNLLFCILNITKYRELKIRISAAYLVKISINNKYLLVRGTNRKHQYQPVGGVYNLFYDGEIELRKFKVQEDKFKPNKLKLRKIMKGRYLNEFIKWFDSEKGREVSIQRKFYEELIRDNILEKSQFPYIDYRILHSNQKKVEYSQELQIHEVLIHNIYELIPIIDHKLGINQEEELKKLYETYENEQHEFEVLKILIKDWKLKNEDLNLDFIFEKCKISPKLQTLELEKYENVLDEILKKIEEIENNRQYIWVDEEALRTNGASKNISIGKHSKYLVEDKK